MMILNNNKTFSVLTLNDHNKVYVSKKKYDVSIQTRIKPIKSIAILIKNSVLIRLSNFFDLSLLFRMLNMNDVWLFNIVQKYRATEVSCSWLTLYY